MRHTCEHCSVAYEIPDHRVAGRFVKVRCKSCDGTMHVVGLRPVDAQGQGGATWWASIANVPRGPYRVDEILALCATGDIAARTRLWCSGMHGWERVCESPMLAFVYDAILANAAGAPDIDNALNRAALLTDGRGWFPDPTLHSGIILLDEAAQRSLQNLASKAERKRHRAEGTRAWPSLFAPLAAALFGAASAAAGIVWFLAASAPS